MGARVRGVKGGGVGARSAGDAGLSETGDATVVSSCGAGAGAVDGRETGLTSAKSRDVGRMGRYDCAGGKDTEGPIIGAVSFAGCSSTLGAEIGSKLNGLLCSLGGGSGDTGDISSSFSISGFSVGEGVISGVSVSTFIVGIGGAGLCAYTISSQSKNIFILQL